MPYTPAPSFASATASIGKRRVCGIIEARRCGFKILVKAFMNEELQKPSNSSADSISKYYFHELEWSHFITFSGAEEAVEKAQKELFSTLKARFLDLNAIQSHSGWPSSWFSSWFSNCWGLPSYTNDLDSDEIIFRMSDPEIAGFWAFGIIREETCLHNAPSGPFFKCGDQPLAQRVAIQ